MFKKLAAMILGRNKTVQKPPNPSVASVPAFNADLRAKGLSEEETSRMLMLRTLTGMQMLHDKGYTREQIYEMPAARYLAVPTDKAGKKRYYESMASIRFHARFDGLGLGG